MSEILKPEVIYSVSANDLNFVTMDHTTTPSFSMKGDVEECLFYSRPRNKWQTGVAQGPPGRSLMTCSPLVHVVSVCLSVCGPVIGLSPGLRQSCWWWRSSSRSVVRGSLVTWSPSCLHTLSSINENYAQGRSTGFDQQHSFFNHCFVSSLKI